VNLKSEKIIMNIPRFFYLFLVLFFLGGTPVLASTGPTEALKPTLQGMIDILCDPAFSGKEQREVRRNKIMAIVGKGFDFEQMSKLVLGRTWKKIDNQQREYFEQLFTKLLENAYIGKLEGYTGQEIIYKDERIKGKKAAVSTVVQSKGTPPLPVNYVMIEASSGWQVYDINIEGVSLLRNYREQFKSILRKEKFDGLIKVLEEKNASFNKEGSK
jgi:phospholipid transport system substrate-binding protein